MSIMNEKILKELVKARKNLKMKFQSIKLDKNKSYTQLENAFKPITEPLEKLIEATSKKQSKRRIHNSREKKFKLTNISELYNKELPTSTPKKEFNSKRYLESSLNEGEEEEENEDEYEEGEDEGDNDDDDASNYISYSDTKDIDISNLIKNKKIDKVYGPRKDEKGNWKLGNANLEINNEKIIVGNQKWASTPGLLELLFFQFPKSYDKSELEIYKKILLDTNVHRRNYNPNEQINGNRGEKYKKIISTLFNKTHKGEGLMRVNLSKPNYIYWDDPNELVERLKLLIASQHAGNNNQSNEILSIIEELREADIIK